MSLIEWKVEGMDCASCAQSLTKMLEREGQKNVYVNFATGDVHFSHTAAVPLDKLKKGIAKLGYFVVENETDMSHNPIGKKLIWAIIFTTPLLLLHILMSLGVMMPPILHNPYLQLALCLPVFGIGMLHFGKSALGSIRNGYPNMDVLIALGSGSAFIYSVAGLILQNPKYIFFETSATIITFVLIGNWLEKRSVLQTTTAIRDLSKLQVETVLKVVKTAENTEEFISVPVAELKFGDILVANQGDRIATDGIVTDGEAALDEAMLTGESEPQIKRKGMSVVGATILISGSIRFQVTAVGKETVLQRIIETVKRAQADKPPVQRLADQISSIFVPLVVALAVLTFVGEYWGLGWSATEAFLNAVAVLVISCPCAMGLATPTAVMVGLGRAAQSGILIKGGSTLEELAKIKQIVFDKTGTLTNGAFEVESIEYLIENKARVHQILYQLESYSSHPIAKSLVKHLKNGSFDFDKSVFLQQVKEEKGVGMHAQDAAGNVYSLGNYFTAKDLTTDESHGLYLRMNNELLATIDLHDQLKSDALATIQQLQAKNISLVILSGDRKKNVSETAAQLNIHRFVGEVQPTQKLELIKKFNEIHPTAMVGDGINDAPALAQANVGISLSNASQIAIQTAQVVLLNGKLAQLPKALAIGKHTLLTIRQNLFWAFSYNLVAIPLAILGQLSPMYAALFMAFSDVIVIGNAIRLKYKNID